MASAAKEWLESDGRGGFAMGTSNGIATRRYHGLLITACDPPTSRLVLVNALECYIKVKDETYAISSHNYCPGVIHPDGAQRISKFSHNPWPTWHYNIENKLQIVQEVFMVRGLQACFVKWRLNTKTTDAVELIARPFISGRDYHATHRHNIVYNFASDIKGNTVSWQPYPDTPTIKAISNGQYEQSPDWYSDFLYEEERHRGQDYVEDLASPGVFTWNLNKDDAYMILSSSCETQLSLKPSLKKYFLTTETKEKQRREAFPSDLHRAVDAYVVDGKNRRTIMAGYPWFTDWGRDSFIAIRGLCISTERFVDAEQILLSWADTVSEGMLPNRFPDIGENPDYNSGDASLWYPIAAYDFINAMKSKEKKLSKVNKDKFLEAIDAILTGYEKGTRYGIKADDDGLMAMGEPGSQLTWMDAMFDGHPVTPRVGKPVEIQALWINGLFISTQLLKKRKKLYEKALRSFQARFWNEEKQCLYDVVDCNHQKGTADGTIRPNQALAIGGLPQQLIDGDRAKRAVDTIQKHLFTPYGMRSLGPEEPGYCPRYQGNPYERDHAYHQGTVWMWPVGPFIEAWLRVRDNSAEAKKKVQKVFLKPLLDHVQEAGLGHCSEILDAEAPHTPRGCPFQAWSVGEVLRIQIDMLGM